MNSVSYYAQDLSTNGLVMLAADLVQYFPEQSHILYYRNMAWTDDRLLLYLMEKGLDLRQLQYQYDDKGLDLRNLPIFPGLSHTAFQRFFKRHEKKDILVIGLLHGDLCNTYTPEIISLLKNDKTFYFYTSNYKIENIAIKKCGFNPYSFSQNLKNIDIFIYPSKQVHFSARPIQDALSMNIPVICPTISLLTEKFQHKKHLLFYDSIEEIPNFVDSLKNHTYRNILASDGREAASRLSLRNQHNKIRELLKWRG